MNYYTAGHKYLRKILLQFEADVAKTDFNSSFEREKIHKDLNEYSFLLRETAKFEIENCHPLLIDKEPFIIAQVEAGYKVAETKEKKLREILGSIEDHERRTRFSPEEQYAVYIATVEYVDTYRQLLSFKEQSLVPVLQKYNADKTLKALTLQSRSQMSIEQMKDNLVDRIFPCLNFIDKIEAIKEIKISTSQEIFDAVWDIVSADFKPHQKTLILNSLQVTV